MVQLWWIRPLDGLSAKPEIATVATTCIFKAVFPQVQRKCIKCEVIPFLTQFRSTAGSIILRAQSQYAHRT